MATPEAITTDSVDTHTDQPLERNRRKVRQGIVTSDKMDKTIVVVVTSLVRHPLYGRTVKQSTKFKAHDENNEAHAGDTVSITETRPTSKSKRWRLSQIIERAK